MEIPMAINQCKVNFGRSPREFSLWDRLTYMRVSKPSWIRFDKTDKLNILFQHTNTLFQNGRVVWGHIIQANQDMFEEGNDDCPGELVYSLTDADRVEPEYLQEVAGKLGSLKGTEPRNQELAPIANYLTDEMVRVFGLDVPSQISPSIRCQISTTLFVRKHLPNRRLCAALLPIVVNPLKPHVAMPLPERYWPDDLLSWWCW